MSNSSYRISFSKTIWVKLGLLVGAFLFAYWRVMPLFLRTWSRDDNSHGFLIPIIVFYLIWIDREKLRGFSIQPNLLGGIILTLTGSFMLLMGDMGGIATAMELSLILVIPGLILLLLGTKYLINLSFPLSYMILMVPVLDFVVRKIHFPFQIFSAMLGSALLGMLNIPVFLRNQYIELPNITLEIAEACSGIRYLVSIIALSIPLAYFTQKSWWYRAVLVTVAIIIGILANGVRIGLIGFWAYYFGGLDIHGPFHIFQGLFVSVVGFIFLIIWTWLLYKIRLRQRVCNESF